MRIEKAKLSNGVRVIAVPLKERRSVSTGIWVWVGGRDEEPRLGGVSHFLEHIVFKGTKNRTTNQIKEEVEGIGGSLNAFTAEECTCFLAKATSDHFERVFDVLADMVLNASLSEPDIEKERTVIMEEIKMTQDQPSHLVEEILSEIMWPDHPLGRPLTGTMKTVGRMSRADIAGYRDAHYQPGFITVVAAGHISLKRLVKAAKTAFGMAKGVPKKSFDLFKSENGGPAVKIFNRETEQTHLSLGLHAFPKEHPDEFALDILSVALGGNMSSRLFNEVREERGLAYDIGSSVRKYHETGSFVVSAGVDRNKLKDALCVILDELQKISKSAVSADELRRAKEFYLGQMDLSLENTMNNMLWVGESMVALGRCRSPEEVHRKVKAVTAGDLRRVAAKLFRGSTMRLAIVGPVSESASSELGQILGR